MRVLHILGSIERSGAETMLLSAVGLFKDAGIEMEAVSTGEDRGRLADAFVREGVRVHHEPFQKSPRFLLGLAQIMRDGSFDVVHVHTERAALWIEITALLAGVRRVVRSVHSAFEFTGWLKLRRAYGRCLSANLLGVVHIFVSKSVAANEKSRFGTTGVLIANGIDASRFVPAGDSSSRSATRAAHGLAMDAIVLVSVGRCTPVKQHDHVLSALSVLVLTIPQLHYIHVGSGPDEEAEITLARRLGIEERCRFLGERDDVVGLLQASDIFMMPSQHEGLSIAALEASACGLPIIAYDVPGLRDAVVNNVTGLLIRPAVDALAAAISELAQDEEQRKSFAQAGRTMVASQHRLRRWVEQHSGIYCSGSA